MCSCGDDVAVSICRAHSRQFTLFVCAQCRLAAVEASVRHEVAANVVLLAVLRSCQHATSSE